MKICILQGAFLPVPPLSGGAVEKMWFSLGPEFVRQGHEVTHVSRTWGSLPSQENIHGVRHLRIKGHDTPSGGFKLKLLDLLYTRRALQVIPDCDVLVTNTFFAPILANRKLAQRMFVDVQRMPKGQMRFYGRAARLRANSSPVAEAIRAEIPDSDHPRVVMVPNPLPFDTQAADLNQEKEQILLYVGRVHPEKGLHLLLQAMPKMKAPWPLKIVGPWQVEQGGGGETYYHELARLAAGMNVEFVGPVYDSEILNSYYRSATFFVYPSLAEKGETFGLAPLEAMAWGCIPIVSSLACFQDFIKHEVNGFIFDHRSADAETTLAVTLEGIIARPEIWNDCSQLALKVNDTHSTSRIARQFLDEFSLIADEIP
jgi:glycosyltransferase involved in cell wall biosynthesis